MPQTTQANCGEQLSTEGFGWITAALRELADDCCEGRLVFSLEGGYDLQALRESVAAVAAVLVDEVPGGGLEVGSEAQPAQTLVKKFRTAHGKHWSCLRA